jgi:biotin carboxyl carrier protein
LRVNQIVGWNVLAGCGEPQGAEGHILLARDGTAKAMPLPKRSTAPDLATGDGQPLRMTYDITIDGKHYRLDLDRVEGGWSCRVDGREVEVDAVLARPDVLSLRIGNQAYEVKYERVSGDTYLWVGSARFVAEVRDPRSLRGRGRAVDDQGPKKLTAPMPGKIVRLLAKPGDAVEAGAGVLVVEAMKMQNEIKSPKKGTIQKILVSEGAAVNAGDVLAIVE